MAYTAMDKAQSDPMARQRDGILMLALLLALAAATAAPAILTFHRAQAGNRQLYDAFASTWVFVGGYLLVWAYAGIAAYAGVLVAEIAAERAVQQRA